MPILHLGVIDVAYTFTPPPAKGRRRRAVASTVSTGDVAGWLENRYHVLENFFQLHGEDVADDVAKSLKGAVESLMMGAPATIDPYGSATSEIESRMKMFLTDREMEKISYPGVPTQAAQRGVNHRLKVKRGPRRPSFVDTGLYLSSLKAWVT
jgi:cytochrome P450